MERAKQILVLAMLLVCIGAIGYTAAQWRTIEVTSSEVPDAREECTTCTGSGTEAKEETCPKCDGSGRQEWKLGGTGMGRSKPLCMRCAGDGSLQYEEDCSTCQGNGYILKHATIYNVREGYSIWEQGLQIIGVSPPPNPKPYRYPFTGIYPAVEKYVESNDREGFEGNVKKWSAARLRNDRWTISVVIEFVDSSGATSEQARRVYFRNRAITGSDRLDK